MAFFTSQGYRFLHVARERSQRLRQHAGPVLACIGHPRARQSDAALFQVQRSVVPSQLVRVARRMESSLGCSIAVPGLDRSIPPLMTAPLSALDDSRAPPAVAASASANLPRAGGQSLFAKVVSGPAAPPPPPPDAPFEPPPPDPPNASPRSLAPSTPIAKRRRKNYVYWTDRELRSLIEGVCMTGARFDRIAPLVRSRTAPACRKQLVCIAARVRAFDASVTSSDAAETVRAYLRVPSAKSGVPAEGDGPRHKITVQLVPDADGDGRVVSDAGRNPCVEVVLRAHRPVWNVVKHLYDKWGYPLQLVDAGGEVVCVDGSVLGLMKDPRTDRVARVRYRFLEVRMDAGLLGGNPGGCGGTRGKTGAEGGAERAPTRPADRVDGQLVAEKPVAEPVRKRPAKMEANTTTHPPPVVAQRPATPSADANGLHVMGRWKARLDSLGKEEPSPAAPHTGTHTGSLGTGTGELGGLGPLSRGGGGDASLSLLQTIGLGLSRDACSLSGDGGGLKKVVAGVPGDPSSPSQLAGSEGYREPIPPGDNATSLGAEDDEQLRLPPRLAVSGIDPSLNFSLMFGDRLSKGGRPDNSGIVP